MKTIRYCLLMLLVAACPFFFIKSASAHHSGNHAVTLNTNDQWEECAMVISPDLTQHDFETFTKEVSSMMYFRPMSGAKPLGRFTFDVGLELARTGKFRDYDPAWNNTFSHPDEMHWLTEDHYLQMPFLSARMGVNDRIDVGIGYAQNFGANYGYLSADVKYSIVNHKKYSLAARSSLTTLFGVRDYQVQQGTVDLLISKTYKWFTPYAGVAALVTTSKETTSKVDLSRINKLSGELVAGTQFQWKYLNLAAEVDLARVNMYAFKIGSTF